MKTKYKILIILGSVVFIVGIITAFFGGILILTYLTNEQNICQSISSPDGIYKAIVFESNAGATSGYVYRVSILKSDKNLLKADMGNVYIEETDYPITVAWNGNSKLIIIQGNGKIYKQEYEFETIDIEYVLPSHR